MRRAFPCPSSLAAAEVRTLARVAAFMPKNPASTLLPAPATYAERGGPSDGQVQKHGHDGHEPGQHSVLAAQERHRAVVDLSGQVGHHVGAFRLPDDIAVHQQRGEQPQGAERPRPLGPVKGIHAVFVSLL